MSRITKTNTRPPTGGGRRRTTGSITAPPFLRKKNRRMTARYAPRVGTALVSLASALLGVGALLGAGVGIHYGWEALRSADRLRVQTIDIRGGAHATAAEVAAYTGIRTGDAILDVDLDGAALALRRHPWIASATVQRRLPDRVTIEITEHAPRLLVALGDVYLADASGTLFKRLSPGDDFMGPVLTGLDRDRAAADTAGTAEIIREAVALDAALAGSELGRVEELAHDRHLGWSVVTLHGAARLPLRVHLGRDPVARIGVALRAVDRLEELGRVAEVIWADGGRSSERVHVRSRPATVAELSPLIAKAGN